MYLNDYRNVAVTLVGDELTQEEAEPLFEAVVGSSIPMVPCPVANMVKFIVKGTVGDMFRRFQREGYGGDVAAYRHLYPGIMNFKRSIKRDKDSGHDRMGFTHVRCFPDARLPGIKGLPLPSFLLHLFLLCLHYLKIVDYTLAYFFVDNTFMTDLSSDGYSYVRKDVFAAINLVRLYIGAMRAFFEASQGSLQNIYALSMIKCQGIA
ncbi:unnamed protein product [Penicillium glandicola]